MTRLRLLLLCAPLPFLFVDQCRAAKRPMNVVLISMDAVRADHAGIYGYSRQTTPNVDAWAREGAVFEAAFSQAPFSLPSHAAIFTSLYPRSHATFGWEDTLPAGLRTLASILKEHGYATAGFTGGFNVHSVYGLGRGFDRYFDSIDRASFSDTVPRAVDWLREHKDGRFFLFVHGYDAHPPYRAPLEWQHRFDPGYKGPIDAMKIDHALMDRIDEDTLYSDASWTKPEKKLEPADLAHLTAHYDGAIAYADSQIGRLLDQLKAWSLDRDTLVILLADHGELVLDHHDTLTSPYGELFEPSLRVPLILRGPGIAPRRVPEPASLVDVLPTVLDLAGLPVEPQAQGRSLLPALRGKSDPDRPIVSQAFPATRPELCTGYRVRDWELVRCPSQEDALFGLKFDPRLLMNAMREAPDTYHTLASGLDAWEKRVPDGKSAPRTTDAKEIAVRKHLREVAYWLTDRPDAARLRDIRRRQQAQAAGDPKWRRFSGDMGRVLAQLFNGIVPEDFLKFFSRDPERRIPREPRVVVAPADGIVLRVQETGETRSIVISLGFTDVHVQRIPFAGKIASMKTEGLGHLSTNDPQHFGNVQVVTELDTELGRFEIRQITGINTKRIQNFVKEGQRVRLGDRMGRILLGSTVILTVPRRVRFTVAPYERVFGGESIIGRY